MKDVIQEAIKLLEDGQAGVLATVVRTKGSTPQKPGAMLLVRQDGSGVGMTRKNPAMPITAAALAPGDR